MVSELQLLDVTPALMAMGDEDGLDDLDSEGEETKSDEDDDFELDTADDEEEQM